MQYLFHRILVTLIGLVIVCNANAHLNPRASIKYQLYIAHFESIMGTSMEMKVKASSSSDAEKAEQKALTEIKRLSLILSAYDKNSEFSKWMATKNEAIKVSSELYTILSLFDQWKQKTNGALNASAEGINQIWKQGALKQQCPSVAEITKAVNEASIKHWQLNPEKNTAIHLSNAPLMLNTFVKSYIIQSAVDKAMKTNDIKAVVLNIGGDIVVAGDINEEIVVTDPKAAAINDAYLENLIIANKAIATSGNYQRGTMINGEWYSHIVDPRTGLPVSDIISATVIANNATDAGALATAMNVLSPQQSEALVKEIGNVDYLIITKEGKRIESDGWKNYAINEKEVVVENKFFSNQWNADYELIVKLELAQLPGFAKRPFAAIWVEDEDHQPIRTMTVWYNKPKWLRDLKAWYSKYYEIYNAQAGNMPSIAGATRSAGKYEIKWDGKDDKGNYVSKGKYNINIEVVREHGTYQLITQEIKIAGSAKQIDLTAGTEIASASIEYRKKDK